jgi:hypothetical protein
MLAGTKAVPANLMLAGTKAVPANLMGTVITHQPDARGHKSGAQRWCPPTF